MVLKKRWYDFSRTVSTIWKIKNSANTSEHMLVPSTKKNRKSVEPAQNADIFWRGFENQLGPAQQSVLEQCPCCTLLGHACEIFCTGGDLNGMNCCEKISGQNSVQGFPHHFKDLFWIFPDKV